MKEPIKIKPVNVFGKSFDCLLLSPANITVDGETKAVKMQAVIYDSKDAVNNIPIQSLPSVKLNLSLDYETDNYKEICKQAMLALNVMLP